MDYEEALKLRNTSEHLVNKRYNSKKIETIVIIPLPLDLSSIAKAAQDYRLDQHTMPSQLPLEYDVVVLFWLTDWLQGTMPLDWMRLDDLLKKI
jgi:hypothetical protein